MNEKFIKWVKILFKNASTTTNVNGSMGNNFKLERGVRQGCPLASYIFLIVEEVLIHNIKKNDGRRKIIGDLTIGGKKQQCILQYADDSSFMVRGDKKFVVWERKGGWHEHSEEIWCTTQPMASSDS